MSNFANQVVAETDGVMKLSVALELTRMWLSLGIEEERAVRQGEAVIDEYSRDPMRLFYGPSRLFDIFFWVETLREEQAIAKGDYAELLLSSIYRNIPGHSPGEEFDLGERLFSEHCPQENDALREKVIANVRYVEPKTDVQRLIYDISLGFLSDSPFRVYLHNCTIATEFGNFGMSQEVHTALMQQMLKAFADRGFVYRSKFFLDLCETKAKINCRKLTQVCKLLIEKRTELEEINSVIGGSFTSQPS
jgi:hypothetical protein